MSNLAECPCSGETLPRLLRPGIMALLARGETHGYQIARQLSRMQLFTGRAPDPPGIYRALKEMSDEGLATSAWRQTEAGPAKRIYALTEDGRKCLDTWLATLHEYRDAINELLALLRRARR